MVKNEKVEKKKIKLQKYIFYTQYWTLVGNLLIYYSVTMH